jgi:hypothetical protein
VKEAPIDFVTAITPGDEVTRNGKGN